jgi:excinuclease ABC subunit B
MQSSSLEGMDFQLTSSYEPRGSQPEAIKKLVSNFHAGKNRQTLLGVTGSGKTFTMANVIQQVKLPTLVIAHNKTLAAQLYNEFKEFFPKNRVEYFVSYYDFYQPESYLPQKDQYIEKDAAINPKLELLRMSSTASLMSRDDVIVVASVSCIYGLGDPKNYKNLGIALEKGMKMNRDELLGKLVSMQYERNDTDLLPGRFRVRGDTIDVVPGYYEEIIRIQMFGDEIESITEVKRIENSAVESFNYFYLFPARHFVVPEEAMAEAIEDIKKELEEQLPKLGDLEAHRLKKRTLYDIEMIKETGYCKGIENYSRFFDKRKHGEKPYCLLDYFPEDFLMIIDESHQTIPQLHAMFNGDKSRKQALVDYGFRLPSAFDNRPLRFVEFERYMKRVMFVSATPSDYELSSSQSKIEQIIRPTGLVDPVIEIRKTENQVSDLVEEIRMTVSKGNRILVTTLTKRLAEELSEYLAAKKVKTRYLHSEVYTLERTEIIRELRLGVFDVLVGINLLREGLDIPEVGLIGILDADKEGFLRDERSLIQTIGRAARNPESKVILYADRMTDSIKRAVAETDRRRSIQEEYNRKHGITPQKMIKPIREKVVDIKDTKIIPKGDIPNLLIELESQMREAAERLNFEEAIALRDRIKELEKRI